MSFRIHPEAVRDIREIASGYAKVSVRVHDQFWNALDDALGSIEASPERHHFDPSGYRRANLFRFPYHVLYQHTAQATLVLVVRHHRRDPAFGLERS